MIRYQHLGWMGCAYVFYYKDCTDVPGNNQPPQFCPICGRKWEGIKPEKGSKMKKAIRRMITRMALECFVLVFVWIHAHWSVALAVTGLTINLEIDNVVLDHLISLQENILKLIEKVIGEDGQL